MVALKEKETMRLQRDISDQDDKTGDSAASKRDPMLLGIVGTAVALAILVTIIAIVWGTGPVLPKAPWYIAFISSFVALLSLSVAYLAFGRYHVMRDVLSFWVGSGFAAYGIGQIFYALTWPGLLPGDQPVLGHFEHTSAWISLINLTILAACLLAAVLTRWPGRQDLFGRRWLGSVLIWLAIVVTGFGVLIYREAELGVLVDAEGRFSTPMRIWLSVLLYAFVAGAILSSVHYVRFRDNLAGHIAFPQIVLVFLCMVSLIGGKRYDLWWYLQRLVLVFGHLTVFIGLLNEYVRLLRRESQGLRLLDAIMENIPIGLTVTGGPPHFQIERVSRHGLEMNQRPVADLIGSPSGAHQAEWRILLPDGVTLPVPDQMPLYRASHFGESVRNAEFVMETQDGEQIPVLVNASPIRDAQGNVVAAINTWFDIVDRKRAEGILKESEALYRAIARSIPNGGVFVVDKDLRYLIAEGQIIPRLGLSREKLEGYPVSDVFDAETSARMEARFHRVFAGETLSYENELNGRIYWTQYALMDEPLEHAIVVTVDITERKQAEKALVESEQRFRGIVNQATAGIVRSNIEGKVIFVNQAFCDMLGFRDSELIGYTLWTFTYLDDLDEYKRLYDRLLEKGTSFQLEKRFIRKDGTILWASISTAPILDSVGKPHSAVSIIVDVTERKQAEEDLRQLNLQLESHVEKRTIQLQTANSALLDSRKRLQNLSQRLVEVQEQERYAIARELHDRVGQSLTALNLNLAIIGDQIADKKTGPVSERLLDSVKLVTEMISIVRDVMSDLRPVVLDEYGLVAALNAYVEKFEKRYDIVVEFAKTQPLIPRLGTALEMTVLRITQEALLNIARHAQASQVTLLLGCEDNSIKLVIEDNGVGIPLVKDGMRDSVQDNVKEGVRNGNGSNPDGHGLMIMRERAEAVGGTVVITSVPGNGTRIEASLPFQRENPENDVLERSE